MSARFDALVQIVTEGDRELVDVGPAALALARERAQLIDLSMEEELGGLFFDRLYIRPSAARS
jgi:hypothetical protein